MAVSIMGVRLDEETIRRLKITAAERGVTLTALFQEALSVWWAKQPEALTHGPLLPREKKETPEEEELAPKGKGKKGQKA